MLRVRGHGGRMGGEASHWRLGRARSEAFSPARVALLGISRGSKVLIFDLRHLREVPVPLPEPVAVFLEDPGRTFYGMGLSHGCGSLAFEFDAVARFGCVCPTGRSP